MATVKIDQWGTKHYIHNGGHHRIDGPAVIYKGGTTWRYENGIQSSREYPCDHSNDGQRLWYYNNKWERIDGPAWDKPNGFKKWLKRGRMIWPKL